MKTQEVVGWACQSFFIISWLLIPNTAFSNDALLEGTKPVESIQDRKILESLTPVSLSQKSDDEVAPIYVTRICGGWYNSKWAEFVDDDIMRRQGSSRILLHLLQYPTNRSVPGSLWQWLSAHPNHPVTSQIIEESLNTVRAGEVFSESRLIDKSQTHKVLRYGDLIIDLYSVRQLAYLMATVLDPRCEQAFEEFDQMGVALDLARSRYASQLTRQKTGDQDLPVSSLPPPDREEPASLPPPTPSEEPISSTPWNIIGVLIVAGLGLLWLLLGSGRADG